MITVMRKVGIGETKFHAVLSSGLLPVGPVYAASVKKRYGFYTGLTARIEGSRENLDGDTLLSQAYEEVCYSLPLIIVAP
ncbi:hypothetical protein HanRHA438_Chr04g0155941 [Helianthus annuus]|nr:hypothetical protein HanRHA438_Chr04g0155941 [Helianthus annuus]